MPVLTNTNLTLADWAKRRDPDGKIAIIANILSQTNEILDDLVFKPANGATSHTCTVATGLPAVYWRLINQGILPSKGSTAQITEGIGMLESRSEVDRALASLEADEAAFRMSESRLRLEAMNQEMARTVFYGNTNSNPEQFLGLAARMSSRSAGNGKNVLDCGGTTALSQTSAYLVGWGDETCFGTFPKGSTAGIEHEDLQTQDVDVFDSAGVYTGKMRALVDWYCWKMGMVLKDWRYAARVCNIEVSQLASFTGAQALTAYATNILHQMLNATYRIPNLGMVRPAWYVNRTLHAALSRMAMEKFAGVLQYSDGVSQFGTARKFLTIHGIPIRRCDAILNTEAVVPA